MQSRLNGDANVRNRFKGETRVKNVDCSLRNNETGEIVFVLVRRRLPLSLCYLVLGSYKERKGKRAERESGSRCNDRDVFVLSGKGFEKKGVQGRRVNVNRKEKHAFPLVNKSRICDAMETCGAHQHSFFTVTVCRVHISHMCFCNQV